ncbi:MAG: hypothetical protein Q9208_000225 [Pyrenodesmia sp. 3 TL-2023]
MIRIHVLTFILLHLLSLFLITTTTLALPATPITSPLLLSLANRTNPLSLRPPLRLPPTPVQSPRPPGSPQPNPLVPSLNGPTPLPPDPPIHCLLKPSTLLPINEYICALVIHRLMHPPDSFRRKLYTAPVNILGNSDCHVELRKSEGKSGIWVSDEILAGAVIAVLRECEGKMGAGWALMEGGANWYLLVYGGQGRSQVGDGGER